MELTAEEWARRAVRARTEGAFELAVQCCREALRLAPMNPSYRGLLTEVLYDRLESRPRHQTAAPTSQPRQAAMPAPMSWEDEAPEFEEEFDEPDFVMPPSARERRTAPPLAPAQQQRGNGRMPLPAPRAFAAAPLFPTSEMEEDEDHPQVVPMHDPRVRPAAARRTQQQQARHQGMRYARPAAITMALIVLLGSAVFGVQALSGSGGSSAVKLPPDLQARITESNKLLTSGDETKAVAKLKEAAGAFPEYGSVINENLVTALEAESARLITRREFTNAMKSLEEATTIEPANAKLWERLGHAGNELAKSTRDASKKRTLIERSELAYRRSLERDEEYVPAMLGLAQIYQARNDKSKAIEYFEKVVDFAPKSSEAKLANNTLSSLKK
jgi:hypothetical protein